ncbi:hypothetical protein FRB94_000596 [Tulasnella sp. JGI-2019a]|nr:hypothetical protein FRB94_000596 [Tulasnella sp. JGI-2019a]KAG9031309.1 hypothetical protein FRB95_002882 [Tulasnella sp. JGI-2019a]
MRKRRTCAGSGRSSMIERKNHGSAYVDDVASRRTFLHIIIIVGYTSRGGYAPLYRSVQEEARSFRFEILPHPPRELILPQRPLYAFPIPARGYIIGRLR